MNPEQKARVDELIGELFDLSPQERKRRLEALTSVDKVVRDEVESLLKAGDECGSFLSQSAYEQVDADLDPGLVGTSLGVWRIGARIGSGGMGEVYGATRAAGDFEQSAAIKILRGEARQQLGRFEIERRILARMEHPGIARLLDGGMTADGRPYMVMEYVHGRPIVEYCTAAAIKLAERLGLFIQVCEAVAYAHSHLIVHRDLKPSNILVTAQGQVKLLDFGIAKPMESATAALTQTAHAPLTPLWAAPEQLLGKPVTTATDTYALGLLLFELLSGAHPWRRGAAPVAQILRQVLQQPAPLASKRAQEEGLDAPVPPQLIRGDLDAIVAKALREEPPRRYVTVEAFKRDIERYLRHEAVEARAGARLYVLGRSLRRHSWTVAATLLVIAALVGAFAVTRWQSRQTEIQRDAARRDAAREEAVRYSLTRIFRAAIAAQAGKPVSAKNLIDDSAQRVLREYRQQPRLAGELVLTLADLYGALEDVEDTGRLLQEFLSQTQGAEPVVVADARQKLAGIELLRGHTDNSAELLQQAEGFWARFPQQYGEERLEGLGIRAKLQRAQGDLDGAVATSKQAIRQRIALSGRNNRETAVLYNSLAITLMSANRLEEALGTFRDTVAIYQAIGFGKELDVEVVRANIGVLEFRTGRLEEAERQLSTAIDAERALVGDSAAVAAAMGYYGRLLWVKNRQASAVPILTEAASMAARDAGPASPVSIQIRLFLGEAQLASGHSEEGRATLEDASKAASAQYGVSHLLTLRARLAVDCASLAKGLNNPQVGRDLTELVGKFATVGRQADGYRALALEQLGQSALAGGDPKAALTSLNTAVKVRESIGVQDWELARARERLGEAQAAVGDPSASRTLKDAESVLVTQLGPDHPEVQRTRKALATL